MDLPGLMRASRSTNGTNKALGASTDTVEALQSIARLAHRLGLQTALIRTAGSKPQRVAHVGQKVEAPTLETAFCHYVLQVNRTVVIEDIARDNPLDVEPASPSGTRFCAGVPLPSDGGSPLGVLALFDSSPQPASADLEADLNDLATLAARELDRTAPESASSPVAPAEPAVVASISENVTDAIFRSEPGQGLTYVNQAGVEMMGYHSAAQLLCVHPKALHANPDRRDEIVHRIDEEGTITGEEVQFVRRDGSTFWGLLSGQAIYDETGTVQHRDGVIVDITPLKEAKAALKESEARWQSLVENHPECVVITVDGIFKYVNPAGAEMLGADHPDELIGRSIFDFVVDPSNEVLRERLSAILEGERTQTLEEELVGLDGKRRVFAVNSVPTIYKGKRAAQTVARDITERKQAERALQAAEEKFRALVEQSLTGIYIIRGLQFEYVNPALADIFGYTQEEIISSLSPMDLTHEADRETVRANIKRRLAGNVEEIQYAFRGRRKNGETIHVEVHGSRTEHNGHPVILGTLLDVTARWEWEQQLITAKEEAEAARQEAEEMNRLKSAFLANMSHEIRTPLTSIIGFAELIGTEPETAPDFAKMIRRSGERLLQTLNSVLDLAQLEAGSLEVTPEPINLTEETESALLQFSPQARVNNLELQFEAPDGPVFIEADPAALGRVLSNLMSNAVKFTNEGHIIARVRSREDAAEVSIEDTGIGIGPDFVDQIFDEFRQESTGAGRTHEGSGLGLTITHRLVDLMGGTIDVESTPGEGTTFTVRLPQRMGNR